MGLILNFQISILLTLLYPYISKPAQVKRRPLSVVGLKRPTSQYAQIAAASGTPTRYQVNDRLCTANTLYIFQNVIYCL